MNDLYEFGGSCNVIIRCNSERKIGGVTYSANEPYTILENVFVNLGYKNITSQGNAKNNIVATRQGLPDTIDISNVVLTDKVSCLIAEKISSQTIGKYYYGTAEDGVIYLPEHPVDEQIFIYHRNSRLKDFVVQNDTVVGDFIDQEQYLIFYNTIATNSCFDFETPHYGYFSLEIIGVGNTDKVSKEVYIRIPAASLMSVPIFDLVNGNILHAPLQFQIIHQNQNKAYFNIGG